MLRNLSVTNYALIESLEIEFSPSLNIITGETGAGKSILLGALGLILGNRVDTGVLKAVDSNCVVEGTFFLKGRGLEHFFDDNDLDYADDTVIRRVITPAGKSRAYVNDVPVQLTTLRELSASLIDIHSQNQSGLVADERFRIHILDSLAANRTALDNYRKAYLEFKYKEKRLEELLAEQERIKRDEDYVRFQWEQLAALGLREGELKELEAEQRRLANAEEILSALALAEGALDGDETGILSRLRSSEVGLNRIGGVLEQAASLAERIRSVYIELRDISSEISDLAVRIESDPSRLETVDSKLGSIYDIMKKHGVADADELITLEKEFKDRLESVVRADEEASSLKKEIEEAKHNAAGLACKLSESRMKAADKLDREVRAILMRLGMPDARFVTEIIHGRDLSDGGADEVRFIFNANKEVQMQPLEKIASGGETSRVMLALKSVLAKNAMLPTIIFDEIDTGVSGRIADVTGDIIADLGKTMQVINITHLPQVASKGDTHFFVYKEDSSSGTKTMIKRLGRAERIDEIAKMLSGSVVTDAAVSQAKTLLGID